MTISIPIQIKTLIPGYSAKWRARHACMIAEIKDLWPRLSHGVDGATPWIEFKGGPRLYGFRTEPENRSMHYVLRHDLPPDMPVGHLRLIKDCLNRYLYPHMRPDLKPSGYSVDQMFGFHGQHKDAIADFDDPAIRERLTAEFLPKADDVIIDCGCFLGFGEVRLAPDLIDGHIYAIEAVQECYDLLYRNLEENGLTNVTPIRRAMWNEETELEIECSFAQANSLIREVHTGEKRQVVRTITVDDIVAEYGIKKLDMLSLTLNGAEVETLEGATDSLSKFKPRIRLAGWYSRDGRKIWEITKDQLEKYDYEVFVGHRGNVMALPKQSGASI
jgi:FkbM family methyltransferase